MDIVVVVGNAIALVAAFFSILLGITKKRKTAISIQTVQFICYAVANFILGGITGAIANIIGIFRNILSYKEKLTKPIMALMIIVSVILTLRFNNLGFIGFLPLINTIIYTLSINEKNPLKFKILFLITFVLWCVYDINIKMYTSAVMDFISVITGIISAYQIYKSNYKKNKKNETK